MSDDLFSALNPIISDLVNPSVSQALALGKKGQSIPVRLPSGVILLAKAGNEINSSQVVLGKDQTGGYLCYAGSSPKPTKRTQKIFKKRPSGNIVKVGKVKILFITRNKNDETKADIYIGGDRSPFEFITTISDYERIVWNKTGITSLGEDLDKWVISIAQFYYPPNFPVNKVKITILNPDTIVEYDNFSHNAIQFLDYKGNGVYSIPRATTFHYKPNGESDDRAKTIETTWDISGFVFGYPIKRLEIPIYNSFNKYIQDSIIHVYDVWLDYATFPLLSLNLQSLSFSNTNFSFSAHNAGLNAIFGEPFFPNLNNDILFSDFTEVRTYERPSKYGFPSYCDLAGDSLNRQLFDGLVNLNLMSEERKRTNPDFELFTDPISYAYVSFENFIDWNEAKLSPDYPSLRSGNEWVLQAFLIESGLLFYHVSIDENVNLSSSASIKGLITQRHNVGFLYQFEPYDTLFQKEAFSYHESHVLTMQLPLTDNVTISTNINKATKETQWKTTGNYHDLLLVGNGCFLTEYITINENQLTANNETEWRIISNGGAVTSFNETDLVTETTTIKRIADNSFFFSPQTATLCNNSTLTKTNSIPTATDVNFEMSVYSLTNNNKYILSTEKTPVTITPPDNRTYQGVSISYHP